MPFGIHMMIGKNYDRVPRRHHGQRAAERAGSGDIASETAAVARRLGHEPRVAFLSYSTFGNPPGKWLDPIREAVAILDAQGDAGFEYEGEMAPDAALNPKVMENYPFSRLSGAGQRAGDAGAAIGQHLGQAAARTGAAMPPSARC